MQVARVQSWLRVKHPAVRLKARRRMPSGSGTVGCWCVVSVADGMTRGFARGFADPRRIPSVLSRSSRRVLVVTSHLNMHVERVPLSTVM
jgi:hypothetical protein